MIITYIVEKFLNSLYTRFAFLYDVVAFAVSWGAWKDWVRSISPYIQGDKVLELGFGTGTLQTHLADRNSLIVGIDQSRQMIRITQKKMNQIPDKYNRLIQANALQLPFNSNYFNTVVTTFPSNYIFNPDTLSGIYRVLRTDGRFIILLSAVPLKASYSGKFLAWLYSITGQNHSINDVQFDFISSILSKAGFECEIINQRMDAAYLIIVKAFPTKKSPK